uniref:Odorant receptor n=2 Tax=Helicoverpa armigera TaxID=29058 RepID=A0A7T3KAG9_HELAM|nr:odorant receptor [Helicoverpa armigera]
METTTYTRSKTTDFFYKMNFAIYIFGLPNFWIEDLKLSKRFVKIYDKISLFNDLLVYLLLVMEFGAFFTQHNLTDKQKFNLMVFAISHPLLCSFCVMVSKLKKKVRLVMYSQAVALKRDYNDPEVEKQMIARSLTYVLAFMSSCTITMIMFAIEAIWDVIRHGATFTTLITAYPDVQDRSVLADVVRVLAFVTWWIFLTKMVAVYMLVIPLTISLRYQFKNLQSYFLSLADLFERSDLSQKEKEEKYEAGLKLGIKLHSETLSCAEDTQDVCRGVFSGQIIFNILLLIVLMAQMVTSERTFVNMFGTVATSCTVITSTGFFMWNAGDVTVEASNLPTAIYFSGWQHCQQESSMRVRRLVVTCMSHAQQPVIFKGLGYIELSYQSFITIVKSSYSVFSVLY